MIKGYLTPLVDPSAAATPSNNSSSKTGNPSTDSSSSSLTVSTTPPGIQLQNGKSLTLGRGPTTKITNPRCSRNQVELIPNFRSKSLLIKQLGPNNSGINGEFIGIGLQGTAKSGDVISLLLDDDSTKYQVHFEGGAEDDKEKDQKPVKIPKMSTTPPIPNNNSNSTDKKKPDKSKDKDISSYFLKTPSSAADSKTGAGTWEILDNGQLLVYSYDIPPGETKPNVAAFDLDGTLITTKSGRVFPQNEHDYKFLYNHTLPKLQTYFRSHSPTTRLIIITNQAGLGNKPAETPGFKRKIQSIIGQLNIPCLVFACTGKTKYRKPLPFLWELYRDKYNGGLEPNKADSFYCGDAGGRKKDFSCSDRCFALNVGIEFKTPEEFFLGAKKETGVFNYPSFDPVKYLEVGASNEHVEFSGGQEMIIMVGYPGSGKSLYTKSTLIPAGYLHVNRDTLKTAAKCLSVAEKGLQDGQSVVIDNTNPKKKDRAEYIKLAQKHKVPVRCFKMNVDLAHASHNNKFRQLTDPSHAPVPTVVFNSYKAQYEEPNLTEGFVEIVPINLVPVFKSDELRNLYSKYLLEK